MQAGISMAECLRIRHLIRHWRRRSYVFIPTECVINPRRACASRVTVVVLCVCMCVYVCPLIPAHIGITKERYQRILRNTGSF